MSTVKVRQESVDNCDPIAVRAPDALLVDIRDEMAPPAPSGLDETGIDPSVLEELALKLAYTVPRFTTQWVGQKLHLPLSLAAELVDQLRRDNSIEMLGQAGHFNHHAAITSRGRERAERLLEISAYVGPAPISLADYAASLEWQFERLPEPSLDTVATALASLTLNQEAVEIIALALLSRRSLFLHGPPGSGKTTVGHLLHEAASGSLWIPHCIGVDRNIIRIFDPTVHEQDTTEAHQANARLIDQRWVRVRQPLIVVGGELTIEALDLHHSQRTGHYEAPLHVKANGGIFLLDDFGCQRVPPVELLNRWIHPLDRHVDFLTLATGQQVAIPFRQMLVVSTNLNPQDVMTPAFLRRIGYRVHLDNPSATQFAEIFHRYAEWAGLTIAPQVFAKFAARYAAEYGPMRTCEPRDLINRAQDVCRLRGRSVELSDEVLDLAWRGYFGT